MRLDAWLLTAARSCIFLMCLACAFAASETRAQDSADAARDASARELFEQGLKLGEQADWPAAEDRFRRALTLRLSPVIAYNLACALSEQGKVIEASETLRRVLVDDKTEPALRQAATQLHAAIAPRIARVTVLVKALEHEDSVRLDDRVLIAAQLNVEIPVDPGSHQLQLERAGKTIDLQTFKLEPGGRQEVHLEAPAVEAMPHVDETLDSASKSGVAASAIPVSAAKPLWSRWWFWTGVAAVVGAGTAVAMAASSGSASAAPSYQGSLGSVQVEVGK
ncbi:MAG TPA: hypothetical protein VFN67_14615 [Polyangiales bacterium]|nr:hypothetical protein [Polyangiales bacterium]